MGIIPTKEFADYVSECKRIIDNQIEQADKYKALGVSLSDSESYNDTSVSER